MKASNNQRINAALYRDQECSRVLSKDTAQALADMARLALKQSGVGSGRKARTSGGHSLRDKPPLARGDKSGAPVQSPHPAPKKPVRAEKRVTARVNTDHRSPLAKARDAFLESDKGQTLCDPLTLGNNPRPYLRNRIESAWLDGVEAGIQSVRDSLTTPAAQGRRAQR